MKHKTFQKTKAALPENEKVIGGDFCQKTQKERKETISKLIKKVKK